MIEQLRREIEQLRHQLAHLDQLIGKIRHKLQSSDMRIWLCFVGGTLVWVLFVMTVYPLSSLSCHWGWFGAPTGGTGLKTIQTTIGVIAAGLVAGSGAVAFHEWQRTRTEDNGEIAESFAARIPLLAFVMMLLNSLYLLIILVSLAPIFTLSVCG
jgi:hypothetical protein